MTSHPNKLAELAAPTRGRVKYAPLTAGLLARKGEALPATPYYAAEALDLYTAGPIVVARHEPTLASPRESSPRDSQLHEHSFDATPTRPRIPQAWRVRRPSHTPESPSDTHGVEPHEIKPAIEHVEAIAQPAKLVNSSEVEHAQRMALSLELELELLARLALHARHLGQGPARIVEDALKAHLAHGGDSCPTCARTLDDNKS
jgi:hypothetical protein